MASPHNDERSSVSVIIPTTCEQARKDVLWRAIDSILSQQRVDLELIVVVNGDRVCEPVYQQLCSHERLRIARRELGSLPAAHRVGRGLVTNEYFAFLDDDDELLPGALQARSEILRRDHSIDAVVSNGYVTYDGSHDEKHFIDFEFVREDPLFALMKQNWLAAGGALFRTETITIDFFGGDAKYHEWTLLAVKLLLASKSLGFLDQPTYRIHKEIPDSLSKSDAYRSAILEFLDQLLTFDIPSHVKIEVKKKLASALHARAEECRGSGDLIGAWKYHLRSMAYPASWRYLSYTRRLLLPARASGQGS